MYNRYKYIKRSFDKFNDKLIKETNDYVTLYDYPLVGTFKMFPRYVKNGEDETLAIIVNFFSVRSWFFLRDGKLILRLNDKENIQLSPIDIKAKTYSDAVIEDVGYVIDQETLKKLADASRVEFQISGKNDGFSGNCTQFNNLARMMYNELYDKNAYIDQLNKVEENNVRLVKEGKNRKTKKTIYRIFGVLMFIVGASWAIYSLANQKSDILIGIMMAVTGIFSFILSNREDII